MLSLWATVVDEAVALRRSLHRQPELTWQEHATAKRIRAELDGLGIPWEACAETGTIGRLATGRDGRHVALRADIDALPIMEATGAEWQSAVPGVMHACGHDGHTATLLAATRWLKAHEDQLPGPVSLLFQPAEEGGHGAKRMIEDGALTGVDIIFGWHNWPSMPRGHALCPDGVVMCANGSFIITLQGHGGHASQPELCRDPVLAAAAITQGLQQVVSRRMAPQEPAVVTVASIMAESADTVIPDSAVVRGSIRAVSLDSRATIEAAITEIATRIASAYGVEAEVEHVPRYGPTVNDSAAAEEFRAALAAELGADWPCQSTAVPLMGSEDFSYYLAEIPGAFAIIGSGEGDGSAGLHNPHYDFNDALIPLVMRLFTRLSGGPVPDPAD